MDSAGLGRPGREWSKAPGCRAGAQRPGSRTAAEAVPGAAPAAGESQRGVVASAGRRTLSGVRGRGGTSRGGAKRGGAKLPSDRSRDACAPARPAQPGAAAGAHPSLWQRWIAKDAHGCVAGRRLLRTPRPRPRGGPPVASMRARLARP